MISCFANQLQKWNRKGNQSLLLTSNKRHLQHPTGSLLPILFESVQNQVENKKHHCGYCTVLMHIMKMPCTEKTDTCKVFFPFVHDKLGDQNVFLSWDVGGGIVISVVC